MPHHSRRKRMHAYRPNMKPELVVLHDRLDVRKAWLFSKASMIASVIRLCLPDSRPCNSIPFDVTYDLPFWPAPDLHPQNRVGSLLCQRAEARGDKARMARTADLVSSGHLTSKGHSHEANNRRITFAAAALLPASAFPGPTVPSRARPPSSTLWAPRMP